MKKFAVSGTIELPFAIEVEANSEEEAEAKGIYQASEEYVDEVIDQRSPYIWVDHVEEVEDDSDGWKNQADGISI